MAIPFLSVDQIVKRALIMIRNHEKFKNPKVLNFSGKPVFITKLRNFDGIDTNTDGITLSIFPYTYHGTSNETIKSGNAALVYEDFEMGTMLANNVSRERCQLALVVTLSYLGSNNSVVSSPAANSGAVIFEESEPESILQGWLTDMWDILLTNPISNLGGLVSGSKVNWGSFRTTDWDRKDHAVIHRANLLWYLDLYTVRNYQQYVSSVDIPSVGNQLTWAYVGVRRSDESPVYWDSSTDQLMNVNGLPLLVTPKGKRVTWNVVTEKFVDPVSRVNLTPVDLEDPSVIPLGPWIDTDLILVGVLMPSRRNLYWNKLTMKLQLADGTLIIALDDGTPISYDPTTGRIKNTNTGVLIDLGNSAFLPTKSGKVSIYDANSLQLRDQFLF